MENKKQSFDQMVGQRIKKQRQKLGITQEDLAAEIHSSAKYVSKIERGISTPSNKKLLEISIALNKPIDYFQMDYPRMNPEYQLKPEFAELTKDFSPFQWKLMLDFAQLIAERYGDAKFREDDDQENLK